MIFETKRVRQYILSLLDIAKLTRIRLPNRGLKLYSKFLDLNCTNSTWPKNNVSNNNYGVVTFIIVSLLAINQIWPNLNQTQIDPIYSTLKLDPTQTRSKQPDCHLWNLHETKKVNIPMQSDHPTLTRYPPNPSHKPNLPAATVSMATFNSLVKAV